MERCAEEAEAAGDAEEDVGGKVDTAQEADEDEGDGTNTTSEEVE